MSLSYPGLGQVAPGTQATTISALIHNLENYQKGNRDVANSETATYKAINEADAYFRFMKSHIGAFDAQKQTEFFQNPDAAEFSIIRKYLCVYANVVLHDFFGNDLYCRARNYVALSNGRTDLQVLFKMWAEQIDANPQNADVFREIDLKFSDTELFPFAFVSMDALGLIVFPFNTIKDVALRRLIGYDPQKNDFTMKKLQEDLISRPFSDRALYAQLVKNQHGGNEALNAFRTWLRNNFNVVNNLGNPYSMGMAPFYCGTTLISSIETALPLLPPPQKLFSEQMLIISSNVNAAKGLYGFSQVSKIAIGQVNAQKDFALVPPLSQELVNLIKNGQLLDGMAHNVEIASCDVQKVGANYDATIHLLVDGAAVPLKNTYYPAHVKKCDNFPLVSVLQAGLNQAWLHRTEYALPDNNAAQGMQINGSEIEFGKNDPAAEIQFGQTQQAFANTFSYFSLRYHDANNNSDVCLGYLYFDTNGPKSLFDVTQNASASTLVIDPDNQIAEILTLELGAGAATAKIVSDPVFSDHLTLINMNGRNDIDAGKWGTPNQTTFAAPNQIVLAPYSDKFAQMVVDNTVSAITVNYVANGGTKQFQIKFTFQGQLMQTHTCSYTPEKQFTIPNPPFFRFVKSHNQGTGQQDIKLVKMQNMGIKSDLLQQYGIAEANALDSNDLIYRIGMDATAQDLKDSMFIGMVPNAKIRLYERDGLNLIYHGLIQLPVWEVGAEFYPLQDAVTNCHAILLVSETGPAQETKIITGRVFDDNMLLVQKDKSRDNMMEYGAWHSSGMTVDVTLPQIISGGGSYVAAFPFSLNILRYLMDGTDIQVSPNGLHVKYDELSQKFQVSVSIYATVTKTENGVNQIQNTTKTFTKEYNANEVIMCDNLPFVLPLGDTSKAIARLNNPFVTKTGSRNHLDSQDIIIDYINPKGQEIRVQDSNNENVQIVPVDGDNIVLRFKMAQGICHLWYQLTRSYNVNALYGLRSDITGAQHVVVYDMNSNTLRKVKMFTDYILYSVFAGTDTFANGTKATRPPKDAIDQESRRLYSIPVTMAFTELLKEKGLEIQSYNGSVSFYTDPNDVGAEIAQDNAKLYVKIQVNSLLEQNEMLTSFDPDHIIALEDYPLPTLTVFPYVNFVAGNSFPAEYQGKPVWNSYNFATITAEEDMPDAHGILGNNALGVAIGSRVAFYANGKRMNFEKRSTKIMDHQQFNRKILQIATVTGWSQYIHMKYDGSNPNNQVDQVLNGQEFGCIIMNQPANESVELNNKAKVGVDFGTRNSIIAISTLNDPQPTFPYHGTSEKHKVIIPSFGNSDEEFKVFTNVSYIPDFSGNFGTGKFASSVMVYSHIRGVNDDVDPYQNGFVPNVKGDVLDKIMQSMDHADGGMGSALSYYTDLKISTNLTAGGSDALMDRNVRTFIKSIMFHVVLNCYEKACASIDVRFSVPSESYERRMSPIWQEAVNYMRERFLPDIPGLREGLEVRFWAKEATALFTYLSNASIDGDEMPPTYSAITDGGDGTYDFTINKFDAITRKLDHLANFSLRYAGQEIMTDSVSVFYDYLRRIGMSGEKDFKNMWCQPTTPQETSNFENLIKKLTEFKNNHGTDRQTEKSLILMLVEQFGINCKTNNLNGSGINEIVTKDGKRFTNVKSTYLNFVSMLQYKFLFLFNVLGEQIRANGIRLDETSETSFNVYLYGGTAQALAVAEPRCGGDLSLYKASGLPMQLFITSMLNFPLNQNGQKIKVKFLPAANSEKHEIVSGLVRDTFDGLYPVGEGPAAHAAAATTFMDNDDNMPAPQDDDMDALFGMEDDFAAAPQAAAPQKRGADYSFESIVPRSVNEVIREITAMTQRQLGKFTIDNYIKFASENGTKVKLSEILAKEATRDLISGELQTMWTLICVQNMDIAQDARTDARAGNLIKQIYLLKMVTRVIESYLRGTIV